MRPASSAWLRIATRTDSSGGVGGGAPAAPSDPGTAPAARLRRKCSTCHTSREEELPPNPLPVLRRCPACQGALARGEAAPGGCTCGAGRTAALVAEAVRGGGRPLDAETGEFFAARFGRGFGGVRVHTGDAADRSARAVDALAYTVGRDVVFRAGTYAPSTPAGKRLLAHELAHVAQQEAAGAPRLSAASAVHVGRADDPLEREADAAAAAVLGAATTPPALTADASPVLRRGALGWLGDAWEATGGRAVSAVGEGAAWAGEQAAAGARWVGGKASAAAEWVGDRAGEAWAATREGLLWMVDRVAPGLVPFLRGDVVSQIREQVGQAIGGAFGGLAERVGREGVVGALSGILSEAAAAVSEAAGALLGRSCDAVQSGVGAIRTFVTAFAGDLFDGVKSAAGSVAGFVEGLWSGFGKPAWEAIKSMAGTAWSWIERTARWLWDLSAPVRNTLADAWEAIKVQFGIAWSTAGGALEWLKEKALAAWETILEEIRPILGPLKVVGTVLVMLSPLGPVAALVVAGPRLWSAMTWLWENWDDLSIVVEAREFLHGTLLPVLEQGLQWLRGALGTAMAWLASALGAVTEAFGALLDALGVSRLLAGLRSLVSTVADFFTSVARWTADTLQPVVNGVLGALSALWEYLRPFVVLVAKLVILSQNPWLWPIVAAGWAWRIIPDCYKGPVVEWILDLMVAAIEALPDFQSLGEAWSHARAKILGALREAQALPVEEKVAVSNRVARIMSGEDLSWIWSLIDGARRVPEHFEGQVQEELVGMDLTQPLPFERSGRPDTRALVASAAGVGVLPPEAVDVLTRPQLTAADVTVDEVAGLELEPELVEAAGLLEEGSEIEFGENPDPAATLEAIRAELAAPEAAPAAAAGPPPGAEGSAGSQADAAPAAAGAETAEDTEAQLQAIMDQPGPDTCGEQPQQEQGGGEVPEEHRIGPLTQGQRGRFMMNQMWKGIRQWFRCNAIWLIPSIIVAVVALIAVEILTAGAITAALPVIMEVLGLIFIGVAVVRGGYYVGEYLARAFAGDPAGAGRALARAVAIAVVEVVFLLLFSVAALLKSIRAAAQRVAQAAARTAQRAAQGARAVGGAVVRTAGQVGRAVRSTGGAVLRQGRIVMTGVGRGIARGARSVSELARRLWRRVRFRRFKLRRVGGRHQLWGLINPWVLLADGRVQWSDRASGALGSQVRVGGRRGVIVGLERVEEGFDAIRGMHHFPDAELRRIARRLRDAGDDVAREAIVQETREAARLIDELVELTGRAPDQRLLNKFFRDVPEGPQRLARLDDFIHDLHVARDARAPRGTPEGTNIVPRQKTNVRTSHDAGVEGGRAQAQRDGIEVLNWDNPRAHIGDYGRGLDDVGREGDRLIVLEWKGEGSRLSGDQMTSDWIGRKLAELTFEGDPMGRRLLEAAAQGKLGGRVYHTRISRGARTRGELRTRSTADFIYDHAEVLAAMEARLRSLRGAL